MWSPVIITCPRCGKAMTILEVALSSDLLIKLEGVCATCGVELTSGPRLILEFITPEQES